MNEEHGDHGVVGATHVGPVSRPANRADAGTTRWQRCLLDQVSKRASGHTPDKKHPEYWNGDIKWISLADCPALDALYIKDTIAKITPAGIANSSAVLLPAGTVVLSRDAGVGKSAIMSVEMAVSQHFMAWQCGPRLDNHFLYYWLQYQKPEFERIANGSTIKTIGLPYFKALTVPLPPVTEQRAIAEALGDVDALLGALDRLIVKKRDLKQSAMQQLLTGRTRMPGCRDQWQQVGLGSIGRIRGGNGFPTRFQGGAQNDYPFYKVSDMNNVGNDTFMVDANSWISETVRKELGATLFPADSLIFAKVGAAVFLERKKILTRASCIDNNLAALVLDKTRAHPRFVHYALLNTRFGDLVSTTALPSLSGSVLSQVAISLPPLPEQAAIAQVLAETDLELGSLEERRDKTRALKQGMMQELLTGRIRLV